MLARASCSTSALRGFVTDDEGHPVSLWRLVAATKRFKAQNRLARIPIGEHVSVRESGIVSHVIVADGDMEERDIMPIAETACVAERCAKGVDMWYTDIHAPIEELDPFRWEIYDWDKQQRTVILEFK